MARMPTCPYMRLRARSILHLRQANKEQQADLVLILGHVLDESCVYGIMFRPPPMPLRVLFENHTRD